ncbi:unnamed protein product [Rhizoctonia solani]|uniref:Uncharacterized protein n=1 Tax=Rhizoctonia solani TaxID=456999 RepID=A0A8H3E9N8_9AGAM|nr:unnamed protein product [Rhizoctonia solani]
MLSGHSFTSSESHSPIFSARPHDSVVPTTSTKSSIVSATELATEVDKPADWAHAITLDPVIKLTFPEVPIFNPIKAIQTVSTSFPYWLKTRSVSKLGFVAPIHYKWRDALWFAIQHPHSKYSTSRGRDFSVSFAIQTIFRACHHHEMRQLDNGRSGNERNALLYLVGETLKLPASSARAQVTTAGGVVLLPILNFSPYTLSPEFRTTASALARTPENLLLVHCVTEFRRVDNGENQMKLDMISALYQKKILGITNQFVFGVFQFDTDMLQINAGLWQDDKIKIYRVGTYSLQAPASLLEFVFALRGINQLGRTYRDQLLESAAAFQEAIKTKPLVDAWASTLIPDINADFGAPIVLE